MGMRRTHHLSKYLSIWNPFLLQDLGLSYSMVRPWVLAFTVLTSFSRRHGLETLQPSPGTYFSRGGKTGPVWYQAQPGRQKMSEKLAVPR